jgi:Tol biopolymer transport system component
MHVARLKRPNMLKIVLVVAAVQLAALGLAIITTPKPAEATYPGENGSIVFTKDICGEGCIGAWTVRPGDNASEKHLLLSPRSEYASYTSGGDRIIYSGGAGVFSVPTSGGDPTLLVSGEGSMGYFQPSLSPDGKTLVASSADLGIYTIELPGGVPKLIARGHSPEWSPDGSRISYCAVPGNGSDHFSIWTIPATGGTPTLVTDGGPTIGNRVLGPCRHSWSPDGERIAYTIYGDGSPPDQDGFVPFSLYTVPVSGGTPRLVHEDSSFGPKIGRTDTLNFGPSGPAYSPDGRYIAYPAAKAASTSPGYRADVYTVPVEGGTPQRITHDESYGSWGIYDIDWQPLPHAYTFGGFLRPVNNPPTLNVVRAGRAVPVKFSLGEDEGLDIFAEGYPESHRIDCTSSAPLDSIEQTVSAGQSKLSYNARTNRYTYTWKTREAWSGTCRQLVVKLDDGSVHRANFKFR